MLRQLRPKIDEMVKLDVFYTVELANNFKRTSKNNLFMQSFTKIKKVDVFNVILIFLSYRHRMISRLVYGYSLHSK